MNKPANSARWYQPWRRAETREQDPADLGTCYGLELTLAADPAPAKPAAPARRGGWVQRLTSKRSASV
jgi:hypothetical protein